MLPGFPGTQFYLLLGLSSVRSHLSQLTSQRQYVIMSHGPYLTRTAFVSTSFSRIPWRTPDFLTSHQTQRPPDVSF